MSTELYWQESGTGQDVVLLHGWGMNGAVWQQTADILSRYVRVHIVDLPGYGLSANAPAFDLESIAQAVLQQAPKNAVWVGWSLGGLVASHIAIHYPEYVSQLVTVASSPKFSAERPWRGIQPKVLDNFTEQLVQDFHGTVDRFMALQAMGSPSARQDVKSLKKSVLTRPEPNQEALLAGLKILADVDVREPLKSVKQPFLRMYGRLDGLVPIKVAEELDALYPRSHKAVFMNSSHAPFMTELEPFCDRLIDFVYQYN